MRLIEGGPVGDRQPVDHTGHPSAVDAVQRRVARARLSKAIVPIQTLPRLSTLMSLARFSDLSRSIGTRRSSAPVLRSRTARPRGCHNRRARRAEHHATRLPCGAPGAALRGLRIPAMHPLCGDVHPPEAGCRGVPVRALRVPRPQAQRDLDRGVTHAAGPVRPGR